MQIVSSLPKKRRDAATRQAVSEKRIRHTIFGKTPHLRFESEKKQDRHCRTSDAEKRASFSFNYETGLPMRPPEPTG